MDDQQSIHERFVVIDLVKSKKGSVSEGQSIAIVEMDPGPGQSQGSFRPLFGRITLTLPEGHRFHVGDELSVSMFVYPPSDSVPQQGE